MSQSLQEKGFTGNLSAEETAFSEKIEQWFEQHREEFIQDLLQWVAYPSIADEKLAQDGKPYGNEVEAIFQHVKAQAEKLGFATEAHQGHALSVLADNRNATQDLGLISHLDVVPPGDNWTFAPFEPFHKQGFVIGRGASDNKGPALLDLYLLRAFRDLGVSLHHKLRVIYGGAEEIGMGDMKYFAKNGPVPRFSVITDGAFPVNYAQKGGLNLILQIPTGPVLSRLSAGVAENAVPASATLRLTATDIATVDSALARLPAGLRESLSITPDGSDVLLVSHGKSGHAAFPENTQNAIPLLLNAAVGAGLLVDADLNAATLIAQLLADPWGHGAGIAFEDEQTGKLTLNGGLAIPNAHGVAIYLDIRYPILTDKDGLLATLKQTIAPLNGSLTILRDDVPMHVDKDSLLVQRLQQTYDAIADAKTDPYTMGGGTHARVLPNAITFGPGFGRGASALFNGENVSERPDFIPDGHGSPHGPDEFVSIENLKRAFKVYAIAIPRLDSWLAQGLIDNAG
ncbi:Sapep family Mn(2+)-dependent dipeptidase [Erwinia rhapontici]|uniref:Peptidase M20 n=1 Tax=Erwinia rhapontici TaxID=55212 RepID=A0ABN6DLG3_ERWRD|nr:Sapep family Mn(2+)-dependent dipeptidase [Erwinia rhapontici]MCS3607474.1 succinyl-diaminopimelate desuccinylase [Erwinia rhapontici]TDT02069.1 succinyl-diaminopimelate desuccinylase [Erwinia rhapontici]BCQ35589.1 peptidase M20 [Erwinia rhapontici]BCQ40490.1 peptidase M20 [Erwinia rhapontici]BCQ45768.1 peptidase M20 [Erwinia rhapontici]